MYLTDDGVHKSVSKVVASLGCSSKVGKRLGIPVRCRGLGWDVRGLGALHDMGEPHEQLADPLYRILSIFRSSKHESTYPSEASKRGMTFRIFTIVPSGA